MTEQLKPCPLCGGLAELKGENETPTDGACWWVQCSDIACFCSIGCHYMSDGGAAAIEAWNRRAQPAQAGQVLTDDPLFVFAQEVIHGAYKPGELKDAAMRAIRHHSAARAKMGVAVPMTGQISEGEFAPDAKLLELADKIDHEQNWRHSGIFQRDHLTQDQQDRVLAGVMLRRYADLMAPESWRLFPPKSVISHSYRAATLEAVVKMAERHGIVGKEGA